MEADQVQARSWGQCCEPLHERKRRRHDVPEVRYTPDNSAITNISIATTDQWKDKSGEKQERTEWHRVAFFGRLAEIAGEYLKKGSQVYVEGRLQTRKWQDKEGQERYTTEIVADRMQMLGARGGMGDGDTVHGYSITAPLRHLEDHPRTWPPLGVDGRALQGRHQRPRQPRARRRQRRAGRFAGNAQPGRAEHALQGAQRLVPGRGPPGPGAALERRVRCCPTTRLGSARAASQACG